MANQRGTFAKRNREMKLKDRAREKAERRATRSGEKRDSKGPEIAWDQPGGTENAAIAETAPAPAPATPSPSPAGTPSGSDPTEQ
jgi:hypothetical protein